MPVLMRGGGASSPFTISRRARGAEKGGTSWNVVAARQPFKRKQMCRYLTWRNPSEWAGNEEDPPGARRSTAVTVLLGRLWVMNLSETKVG